MESMVAEVRAWMTVLQVVVFAGIVWWAYGSARKRRFEEASRLALDDEDFITGATARVPARRDR